MAGAKLPPENQLAARYGVSRITVRQALARLSADGYIDRVHGAGTFVSQRPAPVHHDLSLGSSWRARLAANGHAVESVLTESSVVNGIPAEVATVLGKDLSPDELQGPMIFVERVQRVDGHPIGISQSWLPQALVPGLESKPLVDGSLTLALRQRGIVAHRVDNRLSVALATSIEAERLEGYVDVPLFVVVAFTRLHDGQLMEIARTAWLGSQVRFRSIRQDD